MTENWFEPKGSGQPASIADAARLGDTAAVEQGLRTALQERPLPVADVGPALRAARARGERLVRRRQALTVVAAAVAVVGVTGAGIVVATGGPGRTPTRTALPAATTSSSSAQASASSATTPTASPSVRTIYTDDSYVVPPKTDRPVQAPPTVPTPFVVVKSPCPEADGLGPDDPNPCYLDSGGGYYDPAAWTRYGDLEVLSTAIGTDEMPRSVSTSADGSVMAVTGDGGWIELSAVTSGGTSIEKVVRLSDPRRPADPTNPDYSFSPAVAVHPAGQFVAASWQDGAVMLWNVSDLANPQKVQTIGPESMYTADLLWSPDGSTLATVGYDNTVRLYRLDGDRLRAGAVLRVRSDGLALAWSGDGRRLAAGSYDEAAVFDTTDPDRPRLVSQVPVSTVGQLDLALSPDGSRLYTTGDRAGVYDVRAATGRRLLGLPRNLDSLAVDPAGGTLATLDRKGRLRLLEPSGNAVREKVSGRFEAGNGADSRGLVFDATGERLTVLTTGSAVVVVRNG